MVCRMHIDPPFRADHIGSLIRPPELIAARHRLREGRIDAAGLREIEDGAIRSVVRLQEEIGLQAITDGEYRRGAFFSHFVKSVAGLTVKETRFTFGNDAGDTARAFGPYAEGRLRRARGITTDEFSFVRSVTDRTPKVTMPAPSFINFLGGRERVSVTAYPHMDAYYADLAAIYRQELAALAALGCRYAQLDEVPLAMMEDPKVQETIRALGEEPERLIERYLSAIAEAVRDKPAGMVLGLHLCRGNYKGRWLASGGYGRVAERLFGIPEIDVYLMEYDSPRAGDFSPLSHLPKGKRVVLGLVSTKTSVLEDKAAIKRRIDEAGRHVDLGQLGISPQCGFATNLTGSPMSVADQRAKLMLVVEIAREVWGD